MGRYRAALGKGRDPVGRIPAVGQLRGRRAGGLLLLVPLPETLDAAGGVDELLLAREEGMALAADLDAQLLLRGACRPGLAAGAVDQDGVQLGMDVRFHGTADSTHPGPPAQPPLEGALRAAPKDLRRLAG